MAIPKTQSKSDLIWSGDLLDRRRDADFLINFLKRRVSERANEDRTQSYVLNLDARWGQGKTFFLTRLGQQLEAEGYLSVYINAWQDDHADDPMIAVISEIDAALKPLIRKKTALQKAWKVTKEAGLKIAVSGAKQGAKSLLRKIIGEGVEEIPDIVRDAASTPHEKTEEPQYQAETEVVSDAISVGFDAFLDRYAEEALDTFRKTKESIRSFRERLSAFLNSLQNNSKIHLPFFILVDELDRCRPLYALLTLERIKHLFDVDGIVFIIATDSSQLHHSIKAVYGEGFESVRYLLRFFDRKYLFDEPELESYVVSLFRRFAIDRSKLSCPPNNDHETFFLGAMQYYDLSLRDAEQCFDLLRTAVTVWQQPAELKLVYLLPLIIAHQQGKRELLNSLEARDPHGVKDFSERRRGRWRVPFFKRTDSIHERGQSEEVDVDNLLVAFLNFLRVSLPKVEESGSRPSPSVEWVQRRFRHEFQKVHNSQYQPDKPPYSVMRQYPELVRNAGRLVPEREA